MIQEQLFDALSNNAEVTAIVAQRIYPVRLPRGTVLPAVVYRIPTVDPVNSMSGDSGIENATVQISCWSKEYEQAHGLVYAVRKALLESGLRVVTGSQNDFEDLETHSYAVIIDLNIWSASNLSPVPPGTIGDEEVDPEFTDWLVASFGDPDTDGSWRAKIVSGDLVFQRRVGGVWVDKGGFTQ